MTVPSKLHFGCVATASDVLELHLDPLKGEESIDTSDLDLSRVVTRLMAYSFPPQDLGLVTLANPKKAPCLELEWQYESG